MGTTDAFSMSVAVNPDTSKVQKILDREQNQHRLVVKADINVSDAMKRLKTSLSPLQRVKDINNTLGFEKVNTQIKKNVTAIDSLGKVYRGATVYTETFKNSLGQVKERMSVLTDDGKLLKRNFQTIKEGITAFTTETSKFTQTVNGTEQTVTRMSEQTVDTAGHVKELITETVEYTDVLGRLNKEIIQYTKNQQTGALTQVGTKRYSIDSDTTASNLNTSKTIEQNREIINGFNGIKTVITEVNERGQTLTTTVKEYTDSMGRSVKITQQGNKTFTEMSNSIQGAKQSFGDIITKVAKFYVASLPIRAVQTMITQTISSVKELDSALTEFRKVSDLNGSSLDKYVDNLTELGATVGRTTTEMVQGATEFKKAGFSNEDSAMLAQIASYYQNTADEILSASEATSVLVSMMKAFKIEANDAIHITDAINQVSQDFAVSSGDIGKGLTQAGASLSTYGNSFEQTIGLVTAGTEIFQGKSQQVARGLNTVASRVVKNKDALAEYGVQINDLVTGELRSTYDILADLKPKWDEMSNAQQVALGTTLAGVNQYKVFSAVMNNFDKAIESTNDALNSEGATLRQNEVYMESLQAKLAKLKQEFQKFVNEGGVLNSFIKIILNAGIAILKVANSDIGKLLIKLSALAFSIKGIVLIAGGIKGVMTSVSGGLMTATAGFNALGVAIKSNPLFVGATIATTIFSIKSLADAFGYFKSEAQEAEERAKKLSESFDEQQSKLEENKSKIQSLNDQLLKLQKHINVVSNMDIVSDENLRKLKLQENSLKNQIYYLELMGKIETNKMEKTAMSIYEGKNYKVGEEEVYERQGSYARKVTKDVYGTPLERFEQIQTELKLVQDEMDELEASGKPISESLTQRYTELVEEGTKLATTLNNVNGAIDGVNYVTGQADEKELQIKNAIDASLSSWNALNGITEDTRKGTEGLDKDSLDLYNQLVDLYGGVDQADQAIQDYIESQIEAGETDVTRESAIASLIAETDAYKIHLDRLKARLEELDGIKLSDISGAFKTVTKAVNELNSASGLTLDTYESLMSLDTDYLSVLFDEEGNLRNTADAERQLYYAKIDNLGVTQALALIENAVSIEANNGAGAYVNYAKSIDTATNSMWGLVYAEIAEAKISDASKSVLNKQVKSMENMANQAKKNYKAYTGGTSATKGHTGATKENTNALKENVEMLKKQKEALDDEVDKYEKVINYINSKLDDEIDRLEDLKDTEVDSIDARIDKLKDLADAKDDYYDKEIAKIKELKDQDKEYWNERIQALKDANSELEDQLELQKLLDALESAKKKKVMLYQKGKGFVYQTDQSAVSQAQKNLDEYYRKKNYQDQLKELENQRDAQEKIYEKQIDDLEKKQKAEKDLYDQQIKDLENQKKKIEDKYDKLIKVFQDYKDKFKDQTDAYEKEQNRLLALQLTGIDFENDNWKKRLNNLDGFVSKYISKQKELAEVNELYKKAQAEYEEQQKNASNAAGGYNVDFSDFGGKTPTQDPYFIYKEIYNGTSKDTASLRAGTYQNEHKNEKVKVYYDAKSGKYITMAYVGQYSNETQATNQMSSLSQTDPKTKYRIKQMPKWASGASSIDSDQLAIVGENPNKEIVIGSKLNNGVMAKLPKGSGVVNARSTNTLAGILNQLGFASSNFGIGSGNPINNDSSQNFIIENVTIDGANITDMNSFRNSLMNLKSEATQRAYRRK